MPPAPGYTPMAAMQTSRASSSGEPLLAGQEPMPKIRSRQVQEWTRSPPPVLPPGRYPEAEEIVQFSSSLFFARESEAAAKIDVMRIGHGNTRCSVDFYTQDGSATAGDKYVAVKQTVQFNPGEVIKTVEVPVMNDDMYDTTLEFECYLKDPTAAQLGPYLKTCRVLIVDDDMFPGNKFKQAVQYMLDDGGNEENLSHLTLHLLVEFMRFAFLRVPSVWWKTLLVLLLDQLQNAYYMLRLMLKVYLVDVVLNPDDAVEDRLLIPGSRHLTAIMVAIIYAIPYVAIVFVERIKVAFLDIGRPIRVHLQVNMFRKYLNYTSWSQGLVPVQDFKEVMGQDIPNLVEDGYMVIFALAKGGGKMLIVCIYMLTEDLRAVVPLIIFPILLVMFIRSRMEMHVALEKGLMEADAKCEECIVSAVTEFDLVSAFRMRHKLVDRFCELTNHTRRAYRALRVFDFWDEKLCPMLTLGMVCVCIAFGSQLVLTGLQSIGSFLAAVEIYQELGGRFQDLYEDLMKGIAAGSPLIDLTKMFNLPVETDSRMMVTRARRAYMKDTVDKFKRDHPNCSFEQGGRQISFFDSIPIVLDRVTLKYVKALEDVSVEVRPGELIYVTGGHGTGKTSLLHMVADVRVPGAGAVQISSHLRTLSVSNTPHLLADLNLYENLIFGTRRPRPDRVRAIFLRLGLGKEVSLLKLLDSHIAKTVKTKTGDEKAQTAMSFEADSEGVAQMTGESEGATLLSEGASQETPRESTEDQFRSINWHKELSFSQRKRLHLARAFVCNPEIMVLHRPLDVFDFADSGEILIVMRDYVDNRGIEMPKHEYFSRRPRTLFFSGGVSSNASRNHEIATSVWDLQGDSFSVRPGMGKSSISQGSLEFHQPKEDRGVLLGERTNESFGAFESPHGRAALARTPSEVSDAAVQTIVPFDVWEAPRRQEFSASMSSPRWDQSAAEPMQGAGAGQTVWRDLSGRTYVGQEPLSVLPEQAQVEPYAVTPVSNMDRGSAHGGQYRMAPNPQWEQHNKAADTMRDGHGTPRDQCWRRCV